ncbi:MAG: transglycosylase domain-containing protein, partial [Alphaproteobacteria bacterium]
MLLAIAVADRALPPPLTRALDLSPTLLDADGRLLRAGTSPGGYWRLPARVSDVDPRYLRALLAFEDRRFYAHGGADYRGLARAVVTSALAGRIVSGGSTLSMQTARLLEPRPDRTAQAKVLEILRAWQLERRFNKHEILDLYLVTAPFGGNIDGVAAAARLYFGKAPAELTWAESALLVALPQNPAGRRPDRFPQQAEAARNRVLDVLVAQDILSHEEAERAKREPVPTRRLSMPFHAPTLAERLWEQSGGDVSNGDGSSSDGDATVQTTLHADTQIALEALLAAALDRYAGTINGAMLVIEAETGAVRARVGSSGYFEEREGARLDLTRALRSPGSALKPAIYALAFEAGLAHPATWLPDDQRNFQGYQPENFSRSRQGRVQAYAALQQSLNPPAVALLQALGPERALEALNRAGIHPANQGAPGSVGLSLALGGVSLRMEELAVLFTAFATDGAVRPLCETPAQC